VNRPTPACLTADPKLFDSTSALDHLQARTICARCPIVGACLQAAITESNRLRAGSATRRGPDGTWAGLLWINGEIHTNARGRAQREKAA
jgi:hypothetical protein